MLQAEYDALPLVADMTLEELRDEFVALAPRLSRVETRRSALRGAILKREAQVKAQSAIGSLSAEERAALLAALNGSPT